MDKDSVGLVLWVAGISFTGFCFLAGWMWYLNSQMSCGEWSSRPEARFAGTTPLKPRTLIQHALKGGNMKYIIAFFLLLALTCNSSAGLIILGTDGNGNVYSGTVTIQSLKNKLDAAKDEKNSQVLRNAEALVPYQAAVDAAKADLDAAQAAKRINIVDANIYP